MAIYDPFYPLQVRALARSWTLGREASDDTAKESARGIHNENLGPLLSTNLMRMSPITGTHNGNL